MVVNSIDDFWCVSSTPACERSSASAAFGDRPRPTRSSRMSRYAHLPFVKTIADVIQGEMVAYWSVPPSSESHPG